MRDQAAIAREAIEADKKAAVALPASGKCSIPATELKVGETFVQFMEKNSNLRTLIDTGKGNLQWERDIPPEALANLESLVAKDFAANLGKIIHDIYQTAHVMYDLALYRKILSSPLHWRLSAKDHANKSVRDLVRRLVTR